MLVTITIFLIITGMTFTVVNVTLDRDRVPSGARQIQSYLEGARNRAINAGEPRGVRFILDGTLTATTSGDPAYAATSMVYIGAPSKYNTGEVTIDNGDSRTLTFNPTVDQLRNRGTLATGARIAITDGSNVTYHSIALNDNSTPTITSDDFWMLTRNYSGATLGSGLPFELSLLPEPLPNEEPVSFPNGVCIDLESSRLLGKLPGDWQIFVGGTFKTYSNKMDIVFTPMGQLAASSAGITHLVVADTEDVFAGRRVGQQPKTTDETYAKVGDERLISIFRTGSIIASPIDVTDANNDSDADDPFKFAETP